MWCVAHEVDFLKKARWHLRLVTFELAACRLDAPLMRPINLMSPEGAVIIRTLSNEAAFRLCNHDNHSGDFKKRAMNAVGGHIPCGPAEVEKDKAAGARSAHGSPLPLRPASTY